VEKGWKRYKKDEEQKEEPGPKQIKTNKQQRQAKASCLPTKPEKQKQQNDP
jgi:hypothetical protein